MIKSIFQKQVEYRTSLKLLSPQERISKLTEIQNWILQNRNLIKDALWNDFQKPSEETDLTEIYPVLSEIKHAKRHIKSWMKSRRANKTITLFTYSAYINYEPKGNVLIISPWNFPFLLSIGPLVSAIAAGNSVILKPSEISLHTSELLFQMIGSLFSPEEIFVAQGEKDLATELLSFPFDHIFFTGSTAVGKIVAQSAAKHLTSYTLELGGKSPVIIDKTADLKSAAEKITWGKFINKGQTCVAPDYVLVEESIQHEFLEELKNKINFVYGNGNGEIKSSLSYARIINDHHHTRLTDMMNDAVTNGSEIIFGGLHDKEMKFIEPTLILTNCKNCQISEDEIFGPLLPIISYKNIDEAIDLVNQKTSPLAIYIFTKNNKTKDKIISETKSGGVGINEVVIQFGHHHLPFGGVRHSGIGRSHGYYGFKEFSNQRSYIKGGRINFLKIIYPPYTSFKKKLIDFLIKYL